MVTYELHKGTVRRVAQRRSRDLRGSNNGSAAVAESPKFNHPLIWRGRGTEQLAIFESFPMR